MEDTWPALPESVAQARSAVTAFAEEAGLPAAVVQNLKVAVSEAATNVVLHAYVDRDPGGFTVRVAVDGDDVDVIVRDYGRGMVPRADSPGLGLGLPLIANLVDTFEVGIPDEGGTEVRMRLGAVPA